MSLTAAPPRADDLLPLVEEVSGQNVFACYQCGKCTATCPFSLQPQRVMRLLQLGQVETALAQSTTWDCAGCLTCATDCPKSLSPALVHRALRALHDRVGGDTANGRAHPLRSHLFANIERLSRLGSALAPLSNWAPALPGARFVADRLLGIHRDRSLPPFARRTFLKWFRGHVPAGDAHRGPVVLFHDTFMDYNYPETGIAVTQLLERAGFRVELADKVCCGRPMISKGLLDQAAVQARINVTRLSEQTSDGTPIVGCEPSCLLTLREEYLDLVPAELKERARAVASRAVLVDEFLAALHADGGLELSFPGPSEDGPEVFFHAHCHQKNSAHPALSLELLRLAGYRAEPSEAACCGMAGAYGFEREHYQASRAAGERSLFPAIRERPEARLAVMGASCRQQIGHFTGRPARHLVELLRDALAPA